MKELVLEFNYEEGDFHEFLWHYATKGRGRRFGIWIIGATLLGMGILLFQEGFSIAKLLGILVIGGVFLFFWRLMLKQIGKKSFANSPQMQEKRTCKVSEGGILMTGETFTANYEWREFQSLAETPGQYLLYTAPMRAVILPKRAFADGGHQAFLGFATSIETAGLNATDEHAVGS